MTNAMFMATLARSSDAGASSGWHRKWLLLCAVLVFVFFLRFRIMGWLLSQVITLALRLKAPKFRANAQVQYVKLSPFELGHIEIRCCQNHWRFVCTRITATTRVLEFFRSFVQKKMLELRIEDVYVDVLDVDEQIVKDLIGASKPRKASSTRPQTKSPSKQRNPMGFMRFIDFRVDRIHMNVDCFETRNRLRCTDLRIDIPDVFVAQNYLHLKVEASSIVASSQATEGDMEAGAKNGKARRPSDKNGVDDDIVSCDISTLAAVFDVRLSDQELLGCSIEGDNSEPAFFHVSTAHVERLLQKKMDLIRRELLAIPKWVWENGMTPSSSSSKRTSSSFVLRVTELPVTLDIIHRLSPVSPKVPLHLSLHCCKFEYVKGAVQRGAIKPENSGGTTIGSNNGVQMRLDWNAVSVKADPGIDFNVVAVEEFRMDMMRDDSGHGNVQGSAAGLELAVNPQLSEVLHSLVLFPDTVDEYERQTLQLMAGIVANKQGRTPTPQQPKSSVEWSVDMDIESWALKAWLKSMEGTSRDVEVNGSQLTLKSTIPPRSSSKGMKHAVSVSDALVSISSQHRADSDNYRLEFEDISVCTTKTVTSSAKVMEVAFTASSASVNGPWEQPVRTIPQVVVSNLSLHQTERVSTDGYVQMTLSIAMTEANIITNHQHHPRIVQETSYALGVVDRVRIMLTPPEPGEKSGSPSKKNEPSDLKLNVTASTVQVQLQDVVPVSSCIAFKFTETKVLFAKTHEGTHTQASSGYVKLLWADAMIPGMEISGLRVVHATSVPGDQGASRTMSMSLTARTDIFMTQLRLYLGPGRKILLLLLKIDELVNKKEKDGAGSAKTTTKQALNVTCSTVAVKVHGDTTKSEIAVRQLDVSTAISKMYELTDAVQRYLELTRRDESCRTRLIDCIQAMGVDGSVGAESLTLSSGTHQLINIDAFKLQFVLTDIALQGAAANTLPREASDRHIPPRFLLFDASALAKLYKVHASRGFKPVIGEVGSALADAFDTREPPTPGDHTDQEPLSDWRLRFVGSVDCGVEELVFSLPCEGDVFRSETMSLYDTEGLTQCDRFLQLHLHDVAFTSRQFQKLAVQIGTTVLLLTEREDEEPRVNGVLSRPVACEDVNLPLQLLLLPRAKLDAVVHWKDPKRDRASAPQQFAISFDLVLRGKTATADTLVPISGDTLIALNWDYVYPLLVFFLTSDEDATEPSPRDKEQPAGRAFECIGVQWNVSIDRVQLAWWDAATQDACILMVCNDALSHGIAKLHSDTEATPPKWVIWDTTVYIDLYRVYILRDADIDSESFVPLTCNALPFRSTESSRFFIETAGISYRSTYEAKSESLETDEDEALFGEQGYLTTDQVHAQFVKVVYPFAISSGSRLPRADSVPPSGTHFQPSTPASSPPKSPRAWTHSVRTKLARLKRRTSSMDNLFVNDGSRPIQIDSMKLLWTIETRDRAFYMIAVTSDSFEAIMEATKQASETSISAQNTSTPSTPRSVADGKESVYRPPVTTAKAVVPDDELKVDNARNTRRGSTRVSLLDLLHQGKLGMKDPTSSSPASVDRDERSSSSSTSTSSSSTTPSKNEKGRFESEEAQQAKMIKFKLYTLDVHDAQINILEENSRSSALIASKHIHLDIGLDQFKTMTIATLKFDCVTGHVAPVDVDISAGVLWYAYSRSPASPRSSTSTSSPLLLKQVMDECTLSSTYSHTLTTGATSVEADMSSLHLSTDRHQFYQLLNVLRHVLLAPPNVIRRAKKLDQTHRNEGSTTSIDSNDISVFPPVPVPATAAPLTKKNHHQLIEELRLRDSKARGTARTPHVTIKFISFRAAGCVFRFRTSPEVTGGDHEFVEIRAEGITGSHTFFLNQSTKLVLNLQWLEINNLRPGPSSIAFDDPTAVLKAKLLVDQRHQSSRRVNLANHKGMLTIRAESGPQTRVLGHRLRLLDVLEVSIFPEIPNMIVIQLAADFYELVYKFFFERIAMPEHHHQDAHHSEHVLFGKKAGSQSIINSGTASPTGASASPLSPIVKPRAYTTPTNSPPHPPPLTIRRKSVQMSSISVASESTLATAGSTGNGMAVSPPGEVTVNDDDVTSEDHELFYFKYVRIGNVRLQINCNGFFVNLNSFDLDLPTYVCQSKLCTWKKLLQKFESHLRWHVTKESASTGLSHFKNKLLKWTPAANGGADKKDKHKKEEDTATMNAQVLFGPYSGASGH